MRPMLVLENGVIEGMLARPDIVALIPHCLTGLAIAAAGCGSCGAVTLADIRDYRRVKRCVASLDDGTKGTLLAALGVRQMRVIFGDDGRQQVVTFGVK